MKNDWKSFAGITRPSVEGIRENESYKDLKKNVALILKKIGHKEDVCKMEVGMFGVDRKLVQIQINRKFVRRFRKEKQDIRRRLITGGEVIEFKRLSLQ